MSAHGGPEPPGSRFGRRRLLAGMAAAGAAGAGAVVAGVPPFASARNAGDVRAEVDAPGATVPFHGRHQAGIATPAPGRLLFGAFDVAGGVGRDALVTLLKAWTSAAARMTTGRPLGRNDVAGASPDDTGEALDLAPARLTITFGFGPELFERRGVDRFGIARNRPAALVDLPPFPGDALDPGHCGGDLAVQVCADDPQVAFHALRNLARIGKGTVGVRWVQFGFGRTSSTSRDQATPRNLLGFKDGTNNLAGDDRAAMDEHVWVGSDDVAWMHDGTYLVARRIRMRIETWDHEVLEEQEHVIGRVKASGAPLTGRREHDPVDLDAVDRTGKPVIPLDAHVRLAAPATNGGVRMLRRGYSFTDGVDPRTAGLDAGLFFIAFQRDPRRQFVAVQRRLAEHDGLNEYIQHTGSAVFAVPPGVDRRGWIGETLFAR